VATQRKIYLLITPVFLSNLIPRNVYSQSNENYHMNPVSNNIFAEIPGQLPKELFECIIEKDNILIERIVSNGHVTQTAQWYDQAGDEWVILLQGQATLLFEENQQLVRLIPGDYLLIPAHTRHRVEWTLPDFNTIWLAVHF
jgi:cupin 2 domain-containing protein